MGKNQCVLPRDLHLTWGSLDLGKFILLGAGLKTRLGLGMVEAEAEGGSSWLPCQDSLVQVGSPWGI